MPPYPGNYLDFQIVSPGNDRPLSGLPICKPCLDVRQNPSRDTHFPSNGRRPLPKPKPASKEIKNCVRGNNIYLHKTTLQEEYLVLFSIKWAKKKSCYMIIIFYKNNFTKFDHL